MTSRSDALHRHAGPATPAAPVAALVATVAALALAALSGCGGASTDGGALGPTGPIGPTGATGPSGPAALTLGGLAPAAGPVAGGTTVTLVGDGFEAGATVTFGGVAATGVVVASATQLTAVAPAHAAGAVDVVVTNPGLEAATLAAAFTYRAAGGLPAPGISGVTPASAPVGVATEVRVDGTNIAAGATVTIGGVAATVVGQPDPAGVTVSVVGALAGPAEVVVRNPDGQQATLSGAFDFTGPAPVIVALNRRGSPPEGGQPILIVGTGLAGVVEVTFGGVAVTDLSWVPAQSGLLMTVPPHAEGYVDVVVRTGDGQTDTFAGFHYGPPPVVTGFSPGTGAKGDPVTVTGTDFDASAQVNMGGSIAVVTARGPGSITFLVPKLNPGAYFIAVTNLDGQFGVAAGQFVLPGP